MSDTEIPVPPPEPAPAPLPPKPSPVLKNTRRFPWPLLGLIAFLVLAAGEAYLWQLARNIPGAAGQNAALQSQMQSQISTMQSQIADLQQAKTQSAPAADSVTVQANLAQNLAAVTAQVNAMQSEVAADHGALTNMQANSADLTKLTAKITVLNKLDSARIALESGLPLGELPNAPPPLARYATAPPPTMAQLVLTFPSAARAAESASVAGGTKGDYWSAVLARLENLVTISNGSRVLVGAPAAAVIAQAQTFLNAGDLAGAVTALDTLSVTTQAAMASWLDQARGLLAARQAIIALASQG